VWRWILKIALLSHEGGGISTVCQGLAGSLAKRARCSAKMGMIMFEKTTIGAHKLESTSRYTGKSNKNARASMSRITQVQQ
jgi:hypothetical protein